MKIKHPVVSHEAWFEASKEFLAKEKEFTRQRDELSRLRRELPWEEVTKNYSFETEYGRKSLADLFDRRSQLIVYHFMFGPGWKEGCDGCSFLADHFVAARQHFENHDVKLVVVSRAPLADFLSYKDRMGWTFDWVSSSGSDFNFDFNVSFRANEEGIYNFAPTPATEKDDEAPGMSVFIKESGDTIYHTYSSYARGGDILIGAYNFLDLTPKGRNEATIMDWMKRHDEYDTALSDT